MEACYEIAQAENARKIVFIWNPWSINGMQQYYPGDDYVDWVGVTLLNYESFNDKGQNFTFKELYESISEELQNFTNKPVILAEFGSMDIQGNQEEWTKDAIASINNYFPEIEGLVLFNSAFDSNIPKNDWYRGNYLDWTSDYISFIGAEFKVDRTFNEIISSQAERVFPPTPITNLDFKGINYKKAKRWRNNYYYLSKDILEKDLKLMQNAGISVIKVNPSEIYDYNLRKYTKEFGINIIYQFEAQDVFNFATDKQNLEKSKKEILKKVRKYKDDQNIIGYSFVYDLESYFKKPHLFEQKTAYLNWLGDLITEIKSIEASKSIVLEMDYKEGIESEMGWIHEHLSIDSFGIRIKDTIGLNQFFQFSKEQEISVFISDINTELFLQNSEALKGRNIVLSNFQDEHYSNWVTFDGLIDIYGNPRMHYSMVTNIFNGEGLKGEEIIPKILRPSEGLFPGNSSRYNAYILFNDRWIPGIKVEKEFNFEWSLIKSDEYGNHIAIKKLGTGPYKDVVIPENYKNYRLMLTVIRKNTGLSESDISILYTPAVQDTYTSY